MDFNEWLHCEYLEPEESDNYSERDMLSAWNQAVAECRRIVKKRIKEDSHRRNITEIYRALDDAYYREKLR